MKVRVAGLRRGWRLGPAFFGEKRLEADKSAGGESE